MYYVYVMRDSKSGEFYIGYTNDIERRIAEHQRKFPNSRLVYYEAYLYEQDARMRERKLKYYGSAWRALKKRIGA